MNWWTQFWNRIRGRKPTTRQALVLHADTLRGIVHSIFTTEEHELTCDECFEQLDTFAELVLVGKPIPEALKLVEAHLERCHDCREEFEALMAALRAA